MKKIKTVFSAFKEMHRLEKRLLPTSIVVAIVTAVMPFINIWFTSKIIDLFDIGTSMSDLAIYIGLAVGINAVLFFVNYFLGDMYFMFRSLMYNKELQNISAKLFKAEYQKLESSDFKELIHKHSEAQDRVFSSFVQFSWMMRDFISGAVTLIISVIIIIPLLKIGFTKTGDTYFERPVFLKESSEMFGYVCFHKDGDSYDLGYCFHSAYHSKGYAYEGTKALVEYFASEYGATRFTAGTAINNIPSCRLLEKLGFTCVSTETVSFDNAFSFQGGNYVLNVK